MAVEIKVPALGESVTEATVAKWLVKAGDTVTIDQPLCELETDKVTVEVNASVAGSRRRPCRARRHAPSRWAACSATSRRAPPAPRRSPPPLPRRRLPRRPRRSLLRRRRRAPAPVAAAAPAPARRNIAASGPATRKLVEETGVAASAIQPTGKDGRATKADVLAALSSIPRRQRAAAKARRACRPALARRSRGAGAHDAAAPHHRQPPQGSAEHRGHAHHLQRGGHDGGHGPARAPQGGFREEARRAAGLHVVLRQGLHRRR